MATSSESKLYLYLMSNPDDWHVHAVDLAAFSITLQAETRISIETALCLRVFANHPAAAAFAQTPTTRKDSMSSSSLRNIRNEANSLELAVWYRRK